MKRDSGMKVLWWVMWGVIGVLVFLDAVPVSANPPLAEAVALRARHASLQGQLADNAFRRPLVLDSRQTPGALRRQHSRPGAPRCWSAPLRWNSV